MIIKNLKIKLIKSEGGQLWFETESGQRICLAEDLAAIKGQSDKDFYLSLDNQPIGDESQAVLNELLKTDQD